MEIKDTTINPETFKMLHELNKDEKFEKPEEDSVVEKSGVREEDPLEIKKRSLFQLLEEIFGMISHG